jgi:Txe/YoeB family toxin of Txe-Axe toxin-antitoxin module
MKIAWSIRAWNEDYEYWQKTDEKAIKDKYFDKGNVTKSL